MLAATETCMRALVLTGLAALSLTACTGGQVYFDGDGTSNATVTFTNCDHDVWTTTTASQGYYFFNPFDPDSSDFIEENHIPAGMYLASAKKGSWEDARMVSHNYTESCSIEWNGIDANRPCKRQDFDLGFKPLSGWEHNAKLAAQKKHNDLERYSYFIEYCIHFGGGN